MSYLQQEHVEQCYYKRDDTDYLVRSNESHMQYEAKQYCEYAQGSAYLELANKTFTEYSRESFLEAGKALYLQLKPPQFNKVLANPTQYLEVSRNQFYSLDPDPPHLVLDSVHHVEEDTAHHVEEDTEHHLEESEGESEDEEGEDYCHLIDFNTRLPPEWERKINPGTNMIAYFDKLTQQWQTNKPRILERIEVFDLTVDELMIAISRYDPANSKQSLDKLRGKKATLHRSHLQPIALDALRIWKHAVESAVLHSGVMAANYAERESTSAVDHLSAAERKQKRLELLRKQEDARYRVLEQQRLANQAQFANQNKERASKQQQFRRNISQERNDRANEISGDRRRQQESHAASQAALQEQKQAEEAKRAQKDLGKEHELKILKLLTQFSNGFTFDLFPTMYCSHFGEDWKPEKWFGNERMKGNLMNVFASMRFRDEVSILKSGSTRHVMRQKHYEKLRVHGFDADQIVPMLSLTRNVDDCIKKLKAEQVAAKETSRRMTVREKDKRRESTKKATPGGGGGHARKRPSVKRKTSTRKVKPLVDPGLPPFWEAKKSATGRVYFINHNTHSTTWNDPRPLPSGWRSGKNSKGKTYYINDLTKKTQWKDPRPPLNI